MSHAIQIRQTGGPEVLNWTAVDVSEPGTGQVRLCQAAAGGTGLILCQWAAALGATVIGTVSTEAKAEMAHAHGCNHTILYTKHETGFRSGSFPYLRRRETAGGLRLCRQGYIPALARLSTTTRIDGDVRTSFRSHRPYCTRSTVADGLALSDAPTPLPLHRATRCARSFRERAVRGGRFVQGAH